MKNERGMKMNKSTQVKHSLVENIEEKHSPFCNVDSSLIRKLCSFQSYKFYSMQFSLLHDVIPPQQFEPALKDRNLF